MIRYTAFFIAFLLAVSIASAACTDTDNGKTYYELGNCQAPNGYPGDDECWDWQIVREKFCQDDESCWFYDHPCRYECEDGACIPNPNEYLIPVGYDGKWYGARYPSKNDNIPPCLASVNEGDSINLVTAEWLEFPARVEEAPHSFREHMNDFQIVITDNSVSEGQRQGLIFSASLICEDDRMQCIDQATKVNTNRYPDDGDWMPGFAFGNFSDEIVRKNNYCIDDENLTIYTCADKYNIQNVTVVCENGCSNGHCKPRYFCEDFDEGLDLRTPSYVEITIELDGEEDFVRVYEDYCNGDKKITERTCNRDGTYKSNIESCSCEEEDCCDEGACVSGGSISDVPTTIIPQDPAGTEDSGCCLNPNREACAYYDRAENCCLEWEDEYLVEGGPVDQADCLANYFFVYETDDACAVMGEAYNSFANYEMCSYGCCCVKGPMGDEDYVYTATIERGALCMETDDKMWSPLADIINCDEATCRGIIANGGSISDIPTIADPIIDDPIIPSSTEPIEDEVCANEEFKLCLDTIDPLGGFYHFQATSVPSGVVFHQDQGCIVWTPIMENLGWNIMKFQDTEKGKEAQMGINVLSCCPEFVELPNQESCINQNLEFCLEAEPNNGNLIFSATTYPTGATFTPLSACFLWKPEKEGHYTADFSVSNGECGDQMQVSIYAGSCGAEISSEDGGIDWGQMWVGIGLAVLGILAIALSWIAFPVFFVIEAIAIAIMVFS